MKLSLKWGSIFGLAAFVINLIIPGCIEPFVAFVAAFAAGAQTVRQSMASGKATAIRLGVYAGLVSGLIIIITDLFTSIILAAVYLNKEKLPWLTLPENPYFQPTAVNIILFTTLVFLCMGAMKILFTLAGGISGAVVFRRKTE